MLRRVKDNEGKFAWVDEEAQAPQPEAPLPIPDKKKKKRPVQ